jgi:hypothetical protein
VKTSEQQNKTGVGSYNVSDEELDLSETLKEECNDIGVDGESYEEQKNENHENCDENNFTCVLDLFTAISFELSDKLSLSVSTTNA